MKKLINKYLNTCWMSTVVLIVVFFLVLVGDFYIRSLLPKNVGIFAEIKNYENYERITGAMQLLIPISFFLIPVVAVYQFMKKKTKTAVYTTALFLLLFFVHSYVERASCGRLITPKSRYQESMVVMKGFSSLLEKYKAVNGKYPQTLDEVERDANSWAGRPFSYKVINDGKSYELRSLGEDEQYGTIDDIIFR